jgi:phage terminase large subunit GpA-like protein
MNSLLDTAFSYFAPHEWLEPSEWVRRNIILPAGANETKPGAVDFAEAPYLREIIDSVDAPGVHDVVIVAPTRMGKTFSTRMCWAYTVAGDPAPSLWYDQSRDEAMEVSIRELQPLVEANPILRDRKPANRHHYKNLQMYFPGAAFSMFGGNSVGAAGGKTAMRLFLNEVDKWGEQATEREASMIELVRHRTESFDDLRWHLYNSTPTVEEGPIWQLYQRTDQRQWQAICPHCEEAQALKWDQVKWAEDARIDDHSWDLEKVIESARYECPHCAARWTDPERLRAVQHPDAHWAGSARPEPGWRGYHLTGLYGPRNANRLGELAKDFLASRNTGLFVDRKDFWNSRMGIPWRDDITVITHEKFAAREVDALRGEVPADLRPDIIIIGVDVQTYGLPWVAEVYSWSGRYHTLDHGLAGTWSDLEQIQRDYAARAHARAYLIVDIHFADRRAEALEQILLRQDHGWIAAEGVEQSRELVRMEQANVYRGGRAQASGIAVAKLVISTYELKVELEKAITGDSPGWSTYQLPLAATDIEAREQRDFYAQLLDERRVPRKHRRIGKPAFEWRSRNHNNHAWDCKVYALALYIYLRRGRSRRATPTAKPRGAIAITN